MLVATHKAGDEVELVVMRAGKEEKVKVILETRPGASGR
jgi:hypothetical protein